MKNAVALSVFLVALLGSNGIEGVATAQTGERPTIAQSASSATTDLKSAVDLKSLAGQWRGHPISATGARTPRPVTMYLKEDGTYEAVGDFTAVGTLSVNDKGDIVYQTTLSSGTVTLHVDTKGAQSMKFWRNGQQFGGEFDRLK